MSAALWLGLANHAHAADNCSVVLQFSDPLFAGSYNLANGDSPIYRAGSNSRNWFAFEIPTFDSPLVGAELRVYAGLVWPTNVTLTYELHQVTTPFDDVAYHTGNRTNTFNDLGDGPVFGSRTISSADGWWYGIDALLPIPLNAAALQEITSKQYGWFILGGLATAAAPYTVGWAFDGYGPPTYPVQLVLYFASVAGPEVSSISYDPSLTRLTDDRINLSAVVCGKEPLYRQWMRNGQPVSNATNEVLEIRRLTGADEGVYTLMGSNELGTANSEPIFLQINPATISRQPQSTNIAEGLYLTLSISAQGRSPVNYQWRKNGTNLVGRTGASLNFTPVRLEDSGSYDVVIFNASAEMISDEAQVTVQLAPPTYNDQEPRDHEVAVGLPLALIFYHSGGTPTDYQWFRDGNPIPGATSQTLNIPAIGFNEGGAYWLVAANAAGAATSAVTHVSVHPLLIYNILDTTVLLSNAFQFYPDVRSSSPVTYQWYFNNAPILEGTNQTLQFAAIEFSDEGDYFVVASNAYGGATSAVATLTVVTQPPAVSVYPETNRVWVGEDVMFSSAVQAGPPATLQWFRNGTPLIGRTQALLQLVGVTTNDGGQYRLEASNTHGAGSAEATLTVLEEAPFFINLPLTTNAVAGHLVVLRTKAIAGPPPRYQWRKDGVDLPGETNSNLSLGWVDTGDTGRYEIVARNRVGEARHMHRLEVSLPTGLDRWRWRLPKPQGSRLYALANGSNGYVAAGKAGNIITSLGGQNWTSATVGIDGDLRLSSVGNGFFVVAGSAQDPMFSTNITKVGPDYFRYLESYRGVVLVSSNGTDWIPGRPPGDDPFQKLIFGNGVFVAAGTYGPGFCHVSEDGINWISPLVDESHAYRIVFGNGRFLAEAGGLLYFSWDAYNWTAVGSEYRNLLAYADGRFFSSDSFGVYDSVDGITWTSLGSPSSVFPYWGFSGASGKFVGKVNVPIGQVGFSSDGVTWMPVDTGTRQEIEDIIYANGQFLAVGEAGTITRSSNGLNWAPDEVANKVDFYGVTHGKGQHVIVGDVGTILTSSNGLDWARRTTPSARNLHAVSYGDGKFVAGGRNGVLMSSDDGLTWTERNSATVKYVERIAWANGLWMAVTEQGDITTSPDAVNWVAADGVQFSFTDHEGVAFGNGIWVVVGGYFDNRNRAIDTVFTSTDGSVWTRRFTIAGKRWRDVTFGKGKFVAVGNDGAMAFSTNGIIWSPFRIISPNNLRRVHYANGRFVAVGNDGTLSSSTDPASGLPWAKHQSHSSQNLHDTYAAPDGTFVSVGNNGMVLQSGNTRPQFLSITGDGQWVFDAGITATLRLERSADLLVWETEPWGVTNRFTPPGGNSNKFWRLKGD